MSNQTMSQVAISAMLCGLTQTLHDRPDMRGVLPLADALDESVRCSA